MTDAQRRKPMTSRPERLAERITPMLLLLLAIGGALLMAAPRPAGASPCKPDGQACRTNQSCCGTNGHNGLCVNSNPPGKRPAGACCTPTTCEAAGAQCGSIANGTCLTLAPLNCGTCPDDEICTAAHVCETTTTTTTTTSTSTTTMCIPAVCTFGDCGSTPDDCGGTITCPCQQCTFACSGRQPITLPNCLNRGTCRVLCQNQCSEVCSTLGGCTLDECNQSTCTPP